MAPDDALPPFNPFGPEFRHDPYALYRRYREREPVHWGGQVRPGVAGCWYLTRHADVEAAFKDPRLGREAGPAPDPGQAPPQSTLVSRPLATRSSQLGAAHLPASQTPLPQSSPPRQARPTGHGPQGPPQSMADSPPLCTPSSQAAGAQRSPRQTPATQSSAAAQVAPVGHAGHGPPQSAAVSAPLRMPVALPLPSHKTPTS